MIEKHAERFWAKVQIKGTDECWPWMAALDDKGYGMFKFNGRMHKAHRIAYQLENKRIPRDLFILHQCGNARCVNPDHLYAGTQSQNMHDCVRHGRHNRKKYDGGGDRIRTCETSFPV